MAIDLRKAYYNDGTATVAADGVTVTGQGTLWAQTIRRGDLFGTHVGMPIRILSVDSNTQLTLAYPWKGPAQTAAAYEIQLTFDDVSYQESVRQLLLAMASGNVEALASLAGTAGALPFFTGPGAMDEAAPGNEGQILGFLSGKPTWVDNVGYAAGTLVPAVSFIGTLGDFSASYAQQTGSYIRVGNLVFVRVLLVFTPTFTTTNGTLIITGLPFIPVTPAGGVGSLDAFNGGWSLPANCTALNPSCRTGGNPHVLLRGYGSGVTTNIGETEITSGAQHVLGFSLTYETSD